MFFYKKWFHCRFPKLSEYICLVVRKLLIIYKTSLRIKYTLTFSIFNSLFHDGGLLGILNERKNDAKETKYLK